MDFLVYETIGRDLDRQRNEVAPAIVDELVERATLLSNEDEDSFGMSPILYHDVNPTLRRRAQDAAFERRIAAWLYLDARYTDEDLCGNPMLMREFRTLGNQVRLWFNRQRGDDGGPLSDAPTQRLIARVAARTRQLQQSSRRRPS